MSVTLLYHPLRPFRCLTRTLDALRGACSLEPYRIDLIVQGPADALPDPEEYEEDFDLQIYQLPENIGVGGGMRIGAELALEAGAAWWARIDDDITVPPNAWDLLIAAVSYAEWLPGLPIGGAMMSTGVTRPRILKFTGQGIDVETGYRGEGEIYRGLDAVKWKLVDYVDCGCTLYSRRLLTMGCRPDTAMALGGEGLDLVLQARAKGGHLWLLVEEPTCIHHGVECRPKGYRKVRRDHALVREVGARFREKWGLDCVRLSGAGKKRP